MSDEQSWGPAVTNGVVLGAVIVVFVVVVAVNAFTILQGRRTVRNMNISTLHSRASTWYLTSRPGEPKPDYVLESERLRAERRKEE